MTYTRVLVEIPLNQTYPSTVRFENEYGRILEQEVAYEWKSVLCTKCKKFGHELGECRKLIKEEAEIGEMRKRVQQKRRER